MAVGARRWDAVALLVDPGGWPVLVCQLARAVRRGSGAGPAQGAPERCASVSELSWSDVTDATVTQVASDRAWVGLHLSSRGYIKFVAEKNLRSKSFRCVKSSIV